jgi:CHAP domain/Putative peptidoglycan binding domain
MSELHPILAQKGIKPGTPEAFIAVAQFYADLKYTEKPKNSNHTLFGAWYGVQTAWCAMFVSYCLNHSGNGKTINGAQSKKGFALCSAGIRFFKKKNAWYPVIKAKPGDVAFFDWNHDHNPDHTGLIVKVDVKRKRVLTIEGNTGSKNLSNGGAVMKQWRSMSVIIGVGRPAYQSATIAPAAPVAAVTPTVPVVAPVVAPQPVAIQEPVVSVISTPAPVVTPSVIINPGYGGHLIQAGSKDTARVKYIQQQLHHVVDGIFDTDTVVVVKSFQRKHSLTADGIVGPKTWAALK